MSRPPAFQLKNAGPLVAMAALLLIAILLGGASRQHELRLAVVELTALSVLVATVPAMVHPEFRRAHRFALMLLGLVALLPLVQLIPLPADIWSALPNRAEMRLALDLAGIAPGWAPLTLTPDKTWRSFLALLPPAAMFLAVLQAASTDRVRLIQILLVATGAAGLLGIAQLASGGDQLYPWRTTDAGAVVGFFANRNHMATLCLTALPFCAVLGARAMRRGARENALALALCLALMTTLIVLLGVIRSRTGIVLAGPVLVASLLVAWVAAGRGRPKMFLVGGAAAAAAAAATVGAFALGPIIERFDRLDQSEGRFENWPIVANAADAYLPFGSGLGSFDAVFRSVEPLDLLDATFFNQAHNDYLETWLETGWLGAALLAAFLVWFGRRSWSAWRAGSSTERDLQRAGTVAVAIILLHSAVDYPLRTATIAVLFALFCALVELAGRTHMPNSEADGRPPVVARRRSGH